MGRKKSGRNGRGKTRWSPARVRMERRTWFERSTAFLRTRRTGLKCTAKSADRRITWVERGRMGGCDAPVLGARARGVEKEARTEPKERKKKNEDETKRDGTPKSSRRWNGCLEGTAETMENAGKRTIGSTGTWEKSMPEADVKISNPSVAYLWPCVSYRRRE